MSEPDLRRIEVWGLPVTVNDSLGLLTVTHGGAITWDQLQAIKNVVWGCDARAIEVYPADCDVVNSGNYRHLWRLGPGDFCPDLLSFTPRRLPRPGGLQERCADAWREAERVFA